MEKNFLILFFVGFNFLQANKNMTENHTMNVTAESRNNYVISGTDNNGTVKGNDPELIFKIGSKVDFIIDSPGHPFLLKLKAGIGKKNQIEGIKNNGTTKGVITWKPLKPGTYYYQCAKHKNMVGVIKIIK